LIDECRTVCLCTYIKIRFGLALWESCVQCLFIYGDYGNISV
jgi:hypothetical protein